MLDKEIQIMIRHDGKIYLLDSAAVMSFVISVQRNWSEWTSWFDPPGIAPHREPLPDDVHLTLEIHGHHITVMADHSPGPDEIRAIGAEEIKLLTDGT